MRNFFIWALLYYLRFFARLSLFINRPKIIGITGSVGKSSARNVIYAILKDHFKVKMIKEGNSETGIPLGILGLDPGNYQMFDWIKVMILSPFKIFYLFGTKILIVEMGVDSPYPPKNMDYLLSIVKPDISVVLNVHPVHTMQFDQVVDKNLTEEKRFDSILTRIAEEKMKIITKTKPKIGIINENLASFHPTGVTGTKLMIFGNNRDADIKFLDYQVSLKGTNFVFLFKNEEIKIYINKYILPQAFFEVLGASFLVAKTLGLKNDQIISALKKNFSLPAGRSTVFPGVRNSIIIDSSYNASRAPFLTFIETASYLAKKEKRPFIVLMGDMRELGQETENEHKIVAEAIKKNVDYFFCVGELTKKYVLPEIKSGRWFENSVELGKYLKTHLPYHSVILVKGSQNTIFLEEAIKFILKNKKDEKNLCRQSDFWINKKQYLYGV